MAYEDKIEAKNLLILKEVKPEAPKEGQNWGKEGFILRVVQWVYTKKGKNAGETGGSVALEKRATYLTEDGEVRSGKAKGFTLEDLGIVQKSIKEIADVMRNPPEPKFKSKPAPKKNEDDLESEPF